MLLLRTARTLRAAFETDLLIISRAVSLFFDFNFCSASFLLILYDFIFFVFDLLPIVPSRFPFFDAVSDSISVLGKTYKKEDA